MAIHLPHSRTGITGIIKLNKAIGRHATSEAWFDVNAADAAMAIEEVLHFSLAYISRQVAHVDHGVSRHSTSVT